MCSRCTLHVGNWRRLWLSLFTEGKERNEHFLGDDWAELSPKRSRSSQSLVRLMLGCAIDQQEEQHPLLELGKEGTRNVNQTCFLFCVDDGCTRSCGGGCNVGAFIGRSEVNFAHLPQSLSILLFEIGSLTDHVAH